MFEVNNMANAVQEEQLCCHASVQKIVRGSWHFWQTGLLRDLPNKGGIDYLGDRGRQEESKCCVGKEMKMGIGREIYQ